MHLKNVAIVLFRPQIPENIGAVARAACNMGLTRLHLVQPASLDQERLRMMATPAAAHVLDGMVIHENLAEALGPFQYVVGTTARLGGIRKELQSPREMASRLIDLSLHNDIALLFGPENFGLTNRELPLCHALVTIPTAECTSLNLAQAVMVLCYELFQSSTTSQKETGPLASSDHLERMFDHMEKTLLDIGFLDANHPKRIMWVLRRLFGRSQMEEREVQVLQGIWSKVDWYIGRGKLRTKS